MIYFYITFLLLIVVACGDIFLRGTLGLSLKLKIPFFILGATVIAVGTSSPDLFVGVNAILKDNHDILFGAIIGSSVVNILICIGLASLIYSIPCERKDQTMKFAIYYNTLFAMLFCIFLVISGGEIGIIFSIFLIFSFLFFIFCIIKSGKKDEIPAEEIKESKLYIDVILFAAGLAGLLFFSDLLVQAIIKLSIEKDVQPKVISASIVSFSNSIPEIVTSVLAAFKKRAKIIIGNIVGSNVFILGGILGFSSLIYNIFTGNTADVSVHIMRFDMPMFFLASILLLLFFRLKSSFDKTTGLIFIFIYLVYVLLQFNII